MNNFVFDFDVCLLYAMGSSQSTLYTRPVFHITSFAIKLYREARQEMAAWRDVFSVTFTEVLNSRFVARTTLKVRILCLPTSSQHTGEFIFILGTDLRSIATIFCFS